MMDIILKNGSHSIVYYHNSILTGWGVHSGSFENDIIISMSRPVLIRDKETQKQPHVIIADG